MNSAKESRNKYGQNSRVNKRSDQLAVDNVESETNCGLHKRAVALAGQMPGSKEAGKAQNHELRQQYNPRAALKMATRNKRLYLLNSTWSTEDTSKFGPRVVNKGYGHVKVVQQLTTHHKERRVNESIINASLKKAKLDTISYKTNPRAHSTFRGQKSSLPGVAGAHGISEAPIVNDLRSGFRTPVRVQDQNVGHRRSGSGQVGAASEANRT